MTTTTGDPSSLKTPPSLSGGDLVSRLLAATPPYLYNVPLTPHSFFFSEMLRSFVQAKTSSSSSSSSAEISSSSSAAAAVTTPSSSGITGNLNPRRRKRSWRDARERPLELTIKEKSTDSKYFHQDLSPESHRYKFAPTTNDYTEEKSVTNNNNEGGGAADNKNQSGFEPLKPVDENRPDFLKNRHFFDDPSRLFNNNNNNNEGENLVAEENRKNDSVSGMGFLGDPEKSLKFDLKNQNYGLPTASGTGEFTPSPFWYPPYPIPPQSYPGIDPLHFFIDLRVSGHIWDRKVNSERQPILKGKHCSAFSVPQTVKEYNRPLNLTRDEVKNKENLRGTHFILKNLSKTYREIDSKNNIDKIESNNDDEIGAGAVGSLSHHQDRASPSTLKQDKEPKEPKEPSAKGEGANKKDIRALIGLELVVDYVKEPKEEPQPQPQSPTTHNL